MESRPRRAGSRRDPGAGRPCHRVGRGAGPCQAADAVRQHIRETAEAARTAADRVPRRQRQAMTARNIVEAINNALDEEMGRDDRVMLLGLDVGRLGGVFRATTGLFEKYGDKRVVDTPLAEASIIGASLGLAVAGMVPVAEI